MDQTFDIAIVGAGIVGLAVGREILRRSPEYRLLVLEKEKEVACHQTGHNSGVIHSGIYYKPGSLKAQLCVAGAAAMLEFVKDQGLPYRQCGKIIIATEANEIPALEELYRRGNQNGVPGLRRLSDGGAIREIEPHAAGLCGIQVPSTAITDFRLVAERYSKLIISQGGTLHLQAGVNRIFHKGAEVILSTQAGEFRSRYLINCAGLYSDRIAHMAGAKPDTAILPFRGEYYELLPRKQELVRGLIYPVPDARFPFLGVHFTPRIHGGVEAGPNAVLALRQEGYGRASFSLKDALRIGSYSGFWRMASRYWTKGLGEVYRSWSKAAFTRALQRLLPEIKEQDIQFGGAGVRAQAVDRDGKLVDDFRFVYSENALHVINAPSPAATASLKIAEFVVDLLAKRQVMPQKGRSRH